MCPPVTHSRPMPLDLDAVGQGFVLATTPPTEARSVLDVGFVGSVRSRVGLDTRSPTPGSSSSPPVRSSRMGTRGVDVDDRRRVPGHRAPRAPVRRGSRAPLPIPSSVTPIGCSTSSRRRCSATDKAGDLPPRGKRGLRPAVTSGHGHRPERSGRQGCAPERIEIRGISDARGPSRRARRSDRLARRRLRHRRCLSGQGPRDTSATRTTTRTWSLLVAPTATCRSGP